MTILPTNESAPPLTSTTRSSASPTSIVRRVRRRSSLISEILTTPVMMSSRSPTRSEEHTSELQSLMRISYAVFCLKKKTKTNITKKLTKYHTLKYSRRNNVTLCLLATQKEKK